MRRVLRAALFCDESGTALGRVLLVAVSGYGQLEDKRRAMEAGFDLHLTKPVGPDELARVLQDWAARRAPRPIPCPE
jgi:CheY-like chemotaxis protein